MEANLTLLIDAVKLKGILLNQIFISRVTA